MKKLVFEPVVTTQWQTADRRFVIGPAYPSGFCATDMDHYDPDVDAHEHAFFPTLDEAIQWCQERAQ